MNVIFQIQEQMELKFRKQFPGRKLLDIISSTRIWKIQHNAAVTIQRAWRAYAAKKKGIVKTGVSTHTMKSVNNEHGIGHAIHKIGQFFNPAEHGNRRRSSVRDPASHSSHRRISIKPTGILLRLLLIFLFYNAECI